MLHSVRNLHVLGISVLLVCGAPWAAFAQAQSASGDIETIVVTGQKRSETAAKTPATLDVIDADTIRTEGVVDLQSLNRIVPGYQFEYGSGGNMTLSIRGVGTTSSAQSFEQSVAPYINGVYLGGNNRDFSWPLFDLQRIEVYKGTESGIEGQNTSVGLIDIVTRQPGGDFGGYLTGAGEVIDGGYRAEGAVDIPVADNFQMRVAGYYNDRGGWIDNVVTGHDLGQQRMAAGRVTAVWDVSNNVEVHLYGEYDHEVQIGSSTDEIDIDPTGGYAAYIAPWLTWRKNLGKTAEYMFDPDPGLGVDFGGDSGVRAQTFKGSATVDAKLGGGLTLTSVTAGSFVDDRLSVGQSFSPGSFSTPTSLNPNGTQVLLQNSKYHQITQELRLASSEEDRFSWIIGLWYRNAVQAKTTGIFAYTSSTTFKDVLWPFKATTNNKSIYGDATYKITDTLKLGGTLRYTSETKPSQVQGLGNYGAPFPVFSLYKVNVDHDFIDGSARLQYQPEENVNMYALYSHGTKTGALVDLVASGLPQVVKPEVVQTYEIGTKTSLLDQRLSINWSVFRMNIHNYQDSFTQAVAGTTLFVAANTNATSNGMDLSAIWYPTDSLSINGNVEYLDSQDLSNGGTFVRSPKWQATGGPRYEFPVPLMDITGAVFGSVDYKDSYFNFPNGNANRIPAKTPAYVTADVGVEFKKGDGWTFDILCKNCTNTFPEIRLTNGTFGPSKALAYYDYIPPLRTLTFELTRNF